MDFFDPFAEDTRSVAEILTGAAKKAANVDGIGGVSSLADRIVADHQMCRSRLKELCGIEDYGLEKMYPLARTKPTGRGAKRTTMYTYITPSSSNTLANEIVDDWFSRMSFYTSKMEEKSADELTSRVKGLLTSGTSSDLGYGFAGVIDSGYNFLSTHVYSRQENKFVPTTNEQGFIAKARGVLGNLSPKKGTVVPLYEGDYLDYRFCIVPCGDLMLKPRFENEKPKKLSEVGLTHLYFMHLVMKTTSKIIQAAVDNSSADKDGRDWVAESILMLATTRKSIPDVFYKELPDSEKPIRAGIYNVSQQSFVYIPAADTYADAMDKLRQRFSGKTEKDENGNRGPVKLPVNTIAGTDRVTSSVIYINAEGNPDTVKFGMMAKPTLKAKQMMLQHNLRWLSSYATGGMSEHIHISEGIYRDAFYEVTRASTQVITSLRMAGDYRDPENLQLFDFVDDPAWVSAFNSLADVVLQNPPANSSSTDASMRFIRWLCLCGDVKLIQTCLGKGAELKRQIEENREKINNAKAEDAPALPCMMKKLVSFPHQSVALSKMNVSPKQAVLDVGTGGGKAGILIRDAVNLMEQGLIKRPLIVMPDALIGQFLGEITFFSDGQLNGFAVTSSTMKDKEENEELTKKIRKAPANTIFLTTYSFIANGREDDGFDFEGRPVSSFPNVSFLKDILKPDYVALDESHTIKKLRTAAFQSCNALAADVEYKRIATGTLISNKPEDLIGQLSFLDPNIIGSPQEYMDRYYNKIIGRGGKPTYIGPKDNYAELIRNDLQNNTTYIKATEKDWGALLPKRIYSMNKVPMPESMKKVYNFLVQTVMDEIMKDPVLKDAWEKMKANGENFELNNSLLGKLSTLENFVSAPDSQKIAKYDTSMARTPKLEKIEELIMKSLESPTANNKVIVAVHYNKAAAHLYNHCNPKIKKVADFYNASRKDLIPVFKDPNSNLKVLFAVTASLQTGLNLTSANRIIIADIDWQPGNAKQLEARIFRPDVDILPDGTVRNNNEKKTVYIDTVICDNSVDVLKYVLQATKKNNNNIIMEGYPGKTLKLPKISDDVLSIGFESFGGQIALSATENYNKWLDNAIEENKKLGVSYLKGKHIPNGGHLGTAIIDTPWVDGMLLPTLNGEESLKSYLENLGYDENEDLEDYKEYLTEVPKKKGKGTEGLRVRIEEGMGTIIGINADKKLSVKLDSGGRARKRPITLIIHVKDEDKALADFKKRNANKKEQNIAAEKRKAEQKAKERYTKDELMEMLDAEGITLSRKRSAKDGSIYYQLEKNGETVKVPVAKVGDATIDEWQAAVDNLLEKLKRKAKTGSSKPDKKNTKPLDSKDTKAPSTKPKALDKGDKKTTADKPTKALDKGDKKTTTAPKPAAKQPEEPAVVPNGLFKIYIYPGSFNDIPCLLAYPNDWEQDSGQLEDFMFQYIDDYFAIDVLNKKQGEKILANLSKKYKIPPQNLRECRQFLDELTEGVFPVSFPKEGVRNFFKLNKRMAPQGTLRIYPLLNGPKGAGTLQFVVDKNVHKGLSVSKLGARWELTTGFYMYIAPNLSSFKKMFARIIKNFKVANPKEAKKMAARTLKVKLD